MFQLKLHPHIDEIRTEILVHEKGEVIKHTDTSAIYKFELLDL